ncbi:Lrp/AsnC family transcriptional regulator [Candidatus Micrarchaeota archaeon]|nr:Lrp/AsnC family transcriptional regulator [Candidatus Micrarchaeota archaeon]
MELLDIKDRKILSELDINARISLTELGKRVGLSKEAVHYRIKQLEGKGIIKFYQTTVNAGKLNFFSFRFFIKLKGDTPVKREEILQFLERDDRIQAVFEAEGIWDIFIWVVTKNASDITEVWTSLLSEYRNYIMDTDISIYGRGVYMPHWCIMESREARHGAKVFNSVRGEKLEIDQKDWMVLDALAANARASMRELAEISGMDARTFNERMKKMEKDGIIVSYRPVLGLDKLGIRYYKLHFSLQNISKEKFSELRNFICSHPNTVYFIESVGGWDMEAEVQVRTEEQFRDIISDTKDKFGEYIDEIEVFRYLSERKFIFMPQMLPKVIVTKKSRGKGNLFP